MARPKVRDDALRRRVLDGAMVLLAEGGPPAVTTRAVAAAATTSLPAVDELFGGKPGLIRALFVEGFARLAGDLDAVATTGDPEADLVAMAMAFRRFALCHPHLFEVVFSRPFAEFRPTPADRAAASSIHSAVMARVWALCGPDTPPADVKDAAIAMFALVQGLAELELAGILGSGPDSIERRWRRAVLAAAHGFAPPIARNKTADAAVGEELRP